MASFLQPSSIIDWIAFQHMRINHIEQPMMHTMQ